MPLGHFRKLPKEVVRKKNASECFSQQMGLEESQRLLKRLVVWADCNIFLSDLLCGLMKGRGGSSAMPSFATRRA